MIDIQKVHKSFGGQTIFNDVSVKINKGERVGIVGPNGVGKTTLFSLVTNSSEIDKGNVIIPNNLRIAYLYQYLTDKNINMPLLDYVENAIPELQSVTDKIKSIEERLSAITDNTRDKLMDQLGNLQSKFEALGGYELVTRAETALSGLGFSTDSFDRSLSTFSGGWQMRAALARVLISNSDILLLDEPSNYLDVNAIEWLYKYLRNFQGTLLLVSHDRYLLNMLTTTTLEVNNCKITRYEGNYDYYAEERDKRIATSEAERANLNKKKEQIEKFIDRFRYKSSKAAQVQSRIKMLEKMGDVEIPDNIKYTGTLKLPPPPKSNHEVARLDNSSFSYDGSKWILRDVEISINRGDKIAVVGYNGMGKTTLLKIIAGILPLNEGKRIIPSSTVIGYQAQEFGEILSPESTVYDIVKKECKDTSKLRSVLGTFGFADEAVYKTCKVLSGGEKIRLLFARIFTNPPNLLILDEPTTHLDIRARESLQNVLKTYEGTVCFVSHDIEFIRNSATVIYAVKDTRTKKYYGNYDYYLEKLSEENAPKQQKTVSKALKTGDKRDKRKINAEVRQKYYKKKKELNQMINSSEKLLEKFETEKLELIKKLTSEDPGINYQEINSRLKNIEEEMILNTDKWEKASFELEDIENMIEELTN